MPNVLKSGSLSLLELSGPVQACNGIALPLPLKHLGWTDFQLIGLCHVKDLWKALVNMLMNSGGL